MKGYVIIDNEIVDPEAYSEFLGQVHATTEARGGRSLVRTNDAETVEGDWMPKRLVIIEFDSLEAAKGFLGSAEYTALNDLRHKAAKSRIVVAEGHES